MTRDEAEKGAPQATSDEHERVEARLSEYFEGALGEAEDEEVAAHLEACAVCKAAYQELEQTVGALAGLHRMAAPQAFERSVAETIHRRSAGRFFGRRAFGDRIPFELLALAALILGLAVFAMLRTSETGTLSSPTRGDDIETPADR